MIAGLRRSISGGTVRIALALALVVGASILFWASRDYGVIAPNWDGLVRGVTYSPSHSFTEKEHEWTSPEQIDRDMAQISQLTAHVRTYTVSNGLDRLPEIARRHGLTVSLGIWIGPDLDANEKEIETGIRVALANRRIIDRVIVGNETMRRGDVSADQLNAYIRRVRDALPNRIKVTTAETWSTWLLNPEIGQYVDFIMIHLLPYWEGVPVKGSLSFLQRAYADVQDEFPDKPIVIGECGWPSEGRTRNAAEASVANQAYFIRNFVQLAMDKGYDYYLLEAYDQPWKGDEGAVGAYWGLFDANGNPKFAFSGMLRTFPAWRSYALGAAILTFLLGLLILGQMPRVRQPGYLVMGGLVGLVTTGLLMLLDASTLEYIRPSDIVLTAAMIPLVLLAAAVILTEGIELASILWRVERRELRAAIPESIAARLHSRAMLQRAGRDGHRDTQRIGAARLRQFRSHRPRQQHARCGRLATGGSALCRSRAHIPFLSPGRREGLQGRRAQRGAQTNRSGRRLHRGNRQRLSGRALLAAPRASLFCVAKHRACSRTAGLSRRQGQSLQIHVL